MQMLAVFALVVGAAGADGLIPNASFELAPDKPAGWDNKVWGGSGEFAYVDEGRDGTKCVRISSEKGGDLTWDSKVFVKPYTLYRLSGWIKTENVTPSNGLGAMLNIHTLQRTHTKPITGTTDWTGVNVVFETGNAEAVQVNCLLGGWGLATGTAWYDDLSLEEMGAQEMDLSATINTGATREPMNSYIYGQFIEHLGRCIYGGIWAEMLEDRKFYYDVGAEESPWKAVGDVTMATDAPYVGEHTPALAAGAGLAQSGLGVVAGKVYEGRVVIQGEAGDVTVSLVWGDGGQDRESVAMKIPPQYQKLPFRFTAGATSDDARLEINVSAPARIGTASIMPADNVNGMRPDTLALLKELDSPIYRWPGGNFVSGYDWRDGIGERDKRPPRKNPAWLGIEHNDFGIHEFMAFCAEIGTEPLIVVNSGLGDVQLATDELQYVNGAADTPMGTLRADNGRLEPWNVAWWGIGNEMYGDWQLGHMPLEQYVEKHNVFADAMQAMDPDIKLVGVGATGPWSETMLANCAENMTLLSEHFYCGAKEGLLAHIRQIPDAVKAKADAHRKYLTEIPALKEHPVKIAMDEWNYWYGPHVYGELGVRYYLKDALGIAAGLNEFSRNTDVIEMANYAQTVNVIGCIKTTKTAAAFATTGLALKMYRDHFGTIPVDVAGEWQPLDVAAAWSADRNRITVAAVNPLENDVDLALTWQGAAPTGDVALWRLTGPDPMAYNEPGKELTVTVREEMLAAPAETLSLPALSVTIAEFGVK